MQAPVLKKCDLYAEVEQFRRNVKITPQHYPLNSLCLANYLGLRTKIMDFETQGLKGALILKNNTDGCVFLDERQSPAERNFFCSHEIMHYILHRGLGDPVFACYDAQPQQSRIREWQANEGAAELLLPYRMFIPDFLNLFNPLTCWGDIFNAYTVLAARYNVSSMVVQNRVESLTYEIYQAAYGYPIDFISVISRREQAQRGISVPSCHSIGLQSAFHAYNK